MPLNGLEYEKAELQIPLVETSLGERVVIQYPGKESLREKNTNRWDFRPKLIGREGYDLTFEQVWDPLFDDLKSIRDPDVRRHVASILATLYYRIAYLADYQEVPAKTYRVSRVGLNGKVVGEQSLSLGPFWDCRPPTEAVKEVSERISNWAGMSFEAFLHYNSLLAWNEDMKIRARFDEPVGALAVDGTAENSEKAQKWSASDKRGRINTLLTYIRVIGFIVDEVRPSALLGGFARQRGMSTASDAEVARICQPYIRKVELSPEGRKLNYWESNTS